MFDDPRTSGDTVMSRRIHEDDSQRRVRAVGKTDDGRSYLTTAAESVPTAVLEGRCHRQHAGSLRGVGNATEALA